MAALGSSDDGTGAVGLLGRDERVERIGSSVAEAHATRVCVPRGRAAPMRDGQPVMSEEH
jgi:hypothetical protein